MSTNRLNGHSRFEDLEVLVNSIGESTAPPAKKNPERGSDGRFLKGNQGGPGNPFARKQAALRRAFLGAIDEHEMRVLARMVYTRALEGDPAYAKLLLQYLVGRPTPFIDPDTLDVQEWQIHQDYQARQQEMSTILNGTPLNYLLDLLEPIKEERLRKNFTYLQKGIKALQARDAKKSRQRSSTKTTPTDTDGSNGEPSQTPESATQEDAGSGNCDAAETAASQERQQPTCCGADISPAVPVESKKGQALIETKSAEKVQVRRWQRLKRR